MQFTTWEAILSEIIVGDAFGVDRMDYLLRDGYHTGVVHGKFDHYRLIDTLRILTPTSPSDTDDGSIEPSLGVELGGLSSAEALLLARYFMFSQVYYHPVARIYSIHLKDFLVDNRQGAFFPKDVATHLLLTDNEVTTDILKASMDCKSDGHEHARRIVARQHFKVLYERNPSDAKLVLDPAKAIFEAASGRYGEDKVRFDRLPAKGRPPEFLVQLRDGRSGSAMQISRVLSHIPVQKQDYVFIDPEHATDARVWVDKERENILQGHLE